jgi:hypothetical protein
MRAISRAFDSYALLGAPNKLRPLSVRQNSAALPSAHDGQGEEDSQVCGGEAVRVQRRACTARAMPHRQRVRQRATARAAPAWSLELASLPRAMRRPLAALTPAPLAPTFLRHTAC